MFSKSLSRKRVSVRVRSVVFGKIMIKNILNNLNNKGIEINSQQTDLIREMYETVKPVNNTVNKLTKNKSMKCSFYIWGDVGRGKTLITRSFLDLLEEKKGIFHYIDFMQNIHSNLHALSGASDPLEEIALSFSKKYKIIFIDEFQVEDVTDAMIVGKLLQYLIRLDISLYLTSNAHPRDLYKNGLQRQQFISDMNIISESFNIYELNGGIDYRARNIVNVEKDTQKKLYTDKDIKEIIENNFYNKDYNKKKFHINSREFSCKAFSNDFLWLSFTSFFNEANGPDDYIEISKKSAWIFLSDLKSCDDDSADIIRRFISFIDICYRDRTKIKFFFNDCSYENLYTGERLKILWDRCQSRLAEMQTEDYLG